MHILGPLAVLLVVAFLLRRSLRQPPSASPVDLATLALRDLDAALIDQKDVDGEVHLWCLCLFDQNPQLDLDRVVACLRSDWKLELGAMPGDYPNQRLIRFGETQVSLEPLRVQEGMAIRHGTVELAPATVPKGSIGGVLIRAQSGVGGVGAALGLSQVTRSFLRSCPQITAVYWMSSRVLLSRAQADASLRRITADHWPVSLWVRSHASTNDDGSTVGFTVGLAAMGGTEFEALNAPESPAELVRRLDSLAEYVVARFGMIYNGDTTGVDCMERIRLQKVPSQTVHRGWVFQMRYLRQSSASPWVR